MFVADILIYQEVLRLHNYDVANLENIHSTTIQKYTKYPIKVLLKINIMNGTCKHETFL